MTFSDNTILTVLLVVFSAGKLWGMYREKSENRDWKEWRKFIDAWIAEYKRESEARFDDASDRMSTLAGKVNAMPMQIEDRAAERFMDKALALAHHNELDRRVTMLERQRGRLS